MATDQLNPVIRYLRKVHATWNAADLTDRQLLGRFAQDGDATAFAELMHRHGPLVFQVCRRVLHDRHAAEDAFQATFLLLVRKAGGLRQPDSLGPWLYGVAYRTALRARADGVRRQRHERAACEPRAAATADDLVWHDLRPVLDEAVQRLPRKYREPVVLCYLEGKTNAQAARELGCPEGTVATRLSRARGQLRRYLTKRGVTLSVATLAGVVGRSGTAAVQSFSLTQTTLQAACLLVTRRELPAGLVSAKVLALMEGVLRTMFLHKVHLLLAGVALAGMLAVSGQLVYRARAAGDGEKQPALTPVTIAPPLASQAEPKEAVQIVRYRTANFVVDAPTEKAASEIGKAAERKRKELALLWLGKELPAWQEPCPVEVKITDRGQGGLTTFAYEQGKVARQNMQLEGPLDQLLRSGLPHEVTHTVLAHAFGRPVPRWADEGAAVLSEDREEGRRHDKLLGQLLADKRFIPLRRLFALKDFPEDAMALFAEGYGITRFLVEAKDHQTFLAFVRQGEREGWDKALRAHYGYQDLEDLEKGWLPHYQRTDQNAEAATRPSPDQSFIINQREFRIPVSVESENRDALKHIVLFASEDHGKTWKQRVSIIPTQQGFDFKADRDGLFWFAVQTIYKDGRKQPEAMRDVRPDLRIMVNTRPNTTPTALAEPVPTENTPQQVVPFPGAVLARMDDAGGVLLRLTVTSYRIKGATRDGPNMVTTYEPIITHQQRVDSKAVRVIGIDGKKIDPKRLPNLLAKETPVLTIAEGQAVEPLVLRLLKEDTLIIVLPTQAVYPTPPVTAPAVRER
jgi:RNA polymerase sigma factor (sigma-70 family)